MHTLNIELRLDLDEETKEQKLPIVQELARICAKQLYAGALLVSDKRKPQVSVHCTDFFEGTEKLVITDAD